MTIRFWLLGTIFTIALAFINQFFWFRATPVVVTILVVQLLSYPMGAAMARVLPPITFDLLGPRLSFSLNPGPFNVKEHVLIAACANAAAGTVYAIDIVTIKRIYYKQDLGFFPSLLLVITTQCLGYGLAGMARHFLVRPASMLWPAQLANVALFRTLHEPEDTSYGQVTRLRFFLIATLSSFAYYFLPGYLATFLSTISLLCYLGPNSKVANQLGSGNRGLGLFTISFDWNYIVSFLTSPLVVPFWAQANVYAGFIFVAFVLIPIGYYNNIWDSQNYPLISSDLFMQDGRPYETLAILDDKLQLDESKYATIGPPRMTFFFAIGYGIGFATLTAILSHTILYHGRDIINRLRDARSNDKDIYSKLIDYYPEVPNSWYAGVFIVNLILAIITCEVFGLDLPWWALIFAIFISAIFIIPVGIITAITNQMPGIHNITQMIIGYILPGRTIANITFKTYGNITMFQGIIFMGDMKLGHYMKIPPRNMFIAQTFGTIIAGIVNLSTAYLMFDLIPNICSEEERVWSCDSARVFYNGSVIWGVIGPSRMFGINGYYASLNWWFLVGLLLPVPFWLIARRYPNSWVRYIHMPIFLGGTGNMPPARPGMFTAWFTLGFIFQWVVYRYRNAWWKRYNYILSAGLDSGVALGGLVIFFAFQYRQIVLDWWGNHPDCNAFSKL
ncbi:OPT oligopeptide transporter protein-domain-containing protein [Syncephalis plumigaleata]|nr:OPT oligopeptide transporter protein-domain-containing protein [Syncephalis plumigaleata]